MGEGGGMSSEDALKEGIAEVYRQLRIPAKILISDDENGAKDQALKIIKPLLAVAEKLTGRNSQQLIDSTLRWLEAHKDDDAEA